MKFKLEFECKKFFDKEMIEEEFKKICNDDIRIKKSGKLYHCNLDIKEESLPPLLHYLTTEADVAFMAFYKK